MDCYNYKVRMELRRNSWIVDVLVFVELLAWLLNFYFIKVTVASFLFVWVTFLLRTFERFEKVLVIDMGETVNII